MRLFEIISLVISTIYPILFLLKSRIPKKENLYNFYCHYFHFPSCIGRIPVANVSGLFNGYWNSSSTLETTDVERMEFIYKDFNYNRLCSGFTIEWFSPIIIPIYKLPSPSGKCEIGLKDIHIKTKRPELRLS